MQEISVVSATLTNAYHLQKFEYEFLGNVLRQYGTGLTSLKLEYHKPEAGDIHLAAHMVFCSDSKTLGSLATLTTLRTLSIQVISLFGRAWKDVHLANILPASLERLELADFDGNVPWSEDEEDMDTELLRTIRPGEFAASESCNIRRHVDSEIASVFEDERFERLSDIIIVCTGNSLKLWPDIGRHERRLGEPQIVYSRGDVPGTRKVTCR